MWQAITGAILGGVTGGVTGALSARSQNKTMRYSYKAKAQAASTNAKLAYLRFETQAGYLNEEAAQQVWNSYDNMLQTLGTQKAAQGASGFGVSTGDQRIYEDTYRRNQAQQSGIRRSYYLQNFENERQALSDQNQYNFEAWQANQMAKQYSGSKARTNVFLSGLQSALGSFNGASLFNQKGRVASNTGAGSLYTDAMKTSSTNAKSSDYLNASTNLGF